MTRAPGTGETTSRTADRVDRRAAWHRASGRELWVLAGYFIALVALTDFFNVRLGVELPGGAKASNIGGRPRFGKDDPDAPVFVHRGGGGGHGRRDRVTMNHDYWLWPLPQPGMIRVSCEWPLVGLSFSTAEIDGAVLVEAAERVLPLWPA